MSNHHTEESALNEAFLEHAMTPQNLGVLPEPAIAVQTQGVCGDVIELYMRVKEDRVEAVRFLPHGCLYTTACGSALTCLVTGHPLEQAHGISPEDVENALGGLPREHRHCAALAVAALRAAVRRYYDDRRSPWKRLYQRP